jgi:hypothetical protein
VAPAAERPLRSGARFRTVKVFYRPDELTRRLTALGWKITIRAVSWRFFYAAGHQAQIND